MHKYFKLLKDSTLPSSSESERHPLNRESGEACTELPNSNANDPPSFGSGRSRIDVNGLPVDPGERIQIFEYHIDCRDEVRRTYILRGPTQPRKYNFPQSGKERNMRRFRESWFARYPEWLEYSIKNDAAYCLSCYLFKDGYQGIDESFTKDGFRTWSHAIDSFTKHVGSSPNSVHKQCVRRREDLMKQKQSILTAFDKQDDQTKFAYRVRLRASVQIVRILLSNALSFRGHDESMFSRRKGLFLHLLHFYAKSNEDVGKYVLKNAPGNNQMTSPTIQKEIARACATLTVNAILKDIGDGPFSILVDESSDVSVKEQMAVVLRYVNNDGEVMECLVGLLHVTDTCSLALKNAIYLVLSQLSLSYSRIRGQGYDGASNMRGHINGLRTLIGKDCPSAHYIHCFAHQLQLTLVAVAHNSDDVGEFLEIVGRVLNTVGGSYIRRDLYREKQSEKLQEAMNKGEQITGKGLNQELGLQRPGDTRWGSHLKAFQNIIVMFDPILNVLDAIKKYGNVSAERGKARGVIRSIQTFDFVFVLHLMKEMLEITNALSQALQRRDQDILNAITLLVSAKRQLREKREDEGWDSFIGRVFSFSVKFNIEIPIMDNLYLNRGERSRTVSTITNYHHYRVEVYNEILDMQFEELRCRFPEQSTDLLLGVACLNPANSFGAFEKEKLLTMAKLYPSDFDDYAIRDLSVELDTFIYNVHDDERFFNLKGLSDLYKKFVETQKHLSFPNLHLLVKLALILPVSTATVERVFSAMKIIKTDLRNKISDEFLNDAVITYFEDERFKKVSDESIMEHFQLMSLRRQQLH